jgi:outer membrane protein assembly factor BamB
MATGGEAPSGGERVLASRGKRRSGGRLAPVVLPTVTDHDPAENIRLRRATNPLPRGTLGDLGISVRVAGPRESLPTVLRLPFDQADLEGIDPVTVRVFSWDGRRRTLAPVWASGINVEFGFVWATIRRPGVYVPIGLPRDQVLREVLRQMAVERRLTEPIDDKELAELTSRWLEPLLERPDDEITALRRFVALAEVQTSVAGFADPQLQLGLGGHVDPFPLPHGRSFEEFKDFLGSLETPAGGLPEEALFFAPELAYQDGPPFPVPDRPAPDGDLPWPRPWPPQPIPWPGRPRPVLEWPVWPWPKPPILSICWLFSRNWWMYHHDERHAGVASGCSNIRSTTVSSLAPQSPTAVDGTVVSIPTIVDGKIYVGTANMPGIGPGGRVYRIDLATGAKEDQFDLPRRSPAYYQGVGGSPAVVDGRVYFTAVPGWVFCIDAVTFDEIWRVDLRNPDPGKKQPVRNNIGSSYNADSWSSPLVVNGKVYVGSGEGEDPDTYGFVYCLDATNGHVIWLFCTTKFVNPAANAPPHNSPNVMPPEVAPSDPLPGWATAAGFSIHPAPVPEAGASVWSSCAYDATLNRIYVGTGNSEYTPAGGGTDLPDEMYSSGLISLDADTGELKGFFQPATSDSYRPQDADVDVPGSALVFSRGGQRVVAFGSKNGSFFLLDANTMQVLNGGASRRQLLPRAGGTGVPGDPGATISSVAPVSPPWFENQWGIYATPAVHYGLGKLFVGLGGRGTITDLTKTPFMRALDWNTLLDAWPTAVDPADNVGKYTTAKPPLYGTTEVGLSSPAVVNDVVFVSTNKTAMYALRASDGLCLWSAPGLPSSQQALGPAVYGNFVVVGSGGAVYRYRL